MNKTLDTALRYYLDPNLNDILEFGVYQGKTLKQIAETVNDNYTIYGFDSFVGLPEDWAGTNIKKKEFDLGGKYPDIPGTVIYPGWFEDTIPKYLKRAQPIGLVHVDCDLYSSTKTVLFSLEKWFRYGTVLVFDEWYYNHKDIPQNRQHEQRAFLEFIHHNKWSYEILPEIEDERRIVILYPPKSV